MLDDNEETCNKFTSHDHCTQAQVEARNAECVAVRQRRCQKICGLVLRDSLPLGESSRGRTSHSEVVVWAVDGGGNDGKAVYCVTSFHLARGRTGPPRKLRLGAKSVHEPG